jgi:aspartate/glutamate racemase
MKTIGLIGSMSWKSTVVYYQLLNRMAREGCVAKIGTVAKRTLSDPVIA